MADGDVPGGTGAGGNTAGGDGEEAAWLDLVARFGTPAPAGMQPPWPDREDLAGPVSVLPPAPARPPSLPGLPIAPQVPPLPAKPWPADLGAGPGPGTGPRDSPQPDDPAEEHFIPPVPAPLPGFDPMTKGALLALFGGPLYLLISTAVGATIPALAAFLAVAAFVGGFVVFVLRMDNGRPPDSGPDDGAVV